MLSIQSQDNDGCFNVKDGGGAVYFSKLVGVTRDCDSMLNVSFNGHGG